MVSTRNMAYASLADDALDDPEGPLHQGPEADDALDDHQPDPEGPVHQEPEEEERLCRICLGSDEEPSNLLFRPCSCSGTMAWVHMDCLDRWRRESTNSRSFYRCDQCHFEYQFGQAFEVSGMRFGDRLFVAWVLGLPCAVFTASVAALLALIFLGGFASKVFCTDTWWQVFSCFN